MVFFRSMWPVELSECKLAKILSQIFILSTFYVILKSLETQTIWYTMNLMGINLTLKRLYKNIRSSKAHDQFEKTGKFHVLLQKFKKGSKILIN